MIFMGLLVMGALVGGFGAIDAAVRPFSHWQRIGRSKAGWIWVQLLGLIPFAGIVGIVAAILYVTTVRPKLKEVADELPAQ
jgi:hypothetical protein